MVGWMALRGGSASRALARGSRPAPSRSASPVPWRQEMRLKQASVAVMLAGMWALGCSYRSPTSSGAFMLVLNVSVANTAKAATITDAQLVVDGATAVVFSVTVPAASAALNTSGQAGTGPHTIAVVITGQTTSPNSYTVATPSIQVFDQIG